MSQSKDIQGRPTMTKDYQSASIQEKMDLVKEQYNQMDASIPLVTSRDVQLRTLEIQTIESHLKSGDILDCGCGNGYTTLHLAKKLSNSHLVGVDFSENMIDGANRFLKESQLQSNCEFHCANIFNFLEKDNRKYDTIITERLLINLPSEKHQLDLIDILSTKLKPKGRLILVEASKNGLKQLNEVRVDCELEPIPDVYAGNDSSLKINEEHLKSHIKNNSEITLIAEQNFSVYHLISRALHPLYVKPESPKFSNPLNEFARLLQSAVNTAGIHIDDVGSNKAWIIEKI